MSQRKPFVGGNWKMNLDLASSVALAEAIKGKFDKTNIDIAVFPAFPYISAVAKALEGSSIKVGAQDLYHQSNGAFTGEVSIEMLKDIGVSVVLTGHSERRHVIGENDLTVNAKTKAALESGLEVILCVGETIDQREQNQTDAVNAAQTQYGLAGISGDLMSQLTIAYEPVWAIGTGKTASPEDAQKAHEALRTVLCSNYGPEIANSTRIQYGGSVKPGNAMELFGQTDIDGGLIGGASLKPDDFVAILEAAASNA